MKNLYKLLLVGTFVLVIDRMTRIVGSQLYPNSFELVLQIPFGTLSFGNWFHDTRLDHSPQTLSPVISNLLVLSGIIASAYLLKLNIHATQSMVPIVFGVFSSTADWIIWDAISDPFLVAFPQLGFHIAFNLTDIVVPLGFALYLYAHAERIYEIYSVYSLSRYSKTHS